ncbi:MAG: IclR family transcriptional regulator [Lautropia sp.]
MTAITKALLILELAGRDDSATLASIIEGTGLPRSTAVRIVGELLARQFLERAERGRYRPGPLIRALAGASADEDMLHNRARAHLQLLVAETGETAHYAVYQDGHGIYIDKLEGLHPIRAYTRVGGWSPAYASATGKALLAWQDSREIERVAVSATRYTKQTKVGVRAIVSEMKRVRTQGYAVNRGEWREGVWGIAAPVLDAAGNAIAAIGVSGPEQRVQPRIDHYAGLLSRYAVRVGAAAAKRLPEPKAASAFWPRWTGASAQRAGASGSRGGSGRAGVARVGGGR